MKRALLEKTINNWADKHGALTVLVNENELPTGHIKKTDF